MLQGAWKLKHKQKLEEVEAEEEAAESQDISEDAQEPVPESLQPVSRPMRAIRAPRYAAMERADVLPTRSSRDTETGSPPTPLRRAGRGGPLPSPPPPPQEALVHLLMSSFWPTCSAWQTHQPPRPIMTRGGCRWQH